MTAPKRSPAKGSAPKGAAAKSSAKSSAKGRSEYADRLELDDVDRAILRLLREDGRMPYRRIASELGLTESMVRGHVKRLEESDTMRVVAVTDIEAAGYSLLLSVGVQVKGRDPELVARDLAALPRVFSVDITVGDQDIELLIVAEDQRALHQLLTEELAGIEGVHQMNTSLAVNVVKNQANWAPFREPS